MYFIHAPIQSDIYKVSCSRHVPSSNSIQTQNNNNQAELDNNSEDHRSNNKQEAASSSGC